MVLSIKNGKCQNGYAIATPFEVTETTTLPLLTSAQQAELDALPQVCTLAKYKTTNIYTNS